MALMSSPSQVQESSAIQVLPSNPELSLGSPGGEGGGLKDVERTLLEKIASSKNALANTNNVQDCRAICCLINEAAQALASIRAAGI